MLVKGRGNAFALVALFVVLSGCTLAPTTPKTPMHTGRMELLREAYDINLGDPPLNISFNVEPGWHSLAISRCIESQSQTNMGGATYNYAIGVRWPGSQDTAWIAEQTGLILLPLPLQQEAKHMHSWSEEAGIPSGEWNILTRGNASATLRLLAWVQADPITEKDEVTCAQARGNAAQRDDVAGPVSPASWDKSVQRSIT